MASDQLPLVPPGQRAVSQTLGSASQTGDPPETRPRRSHLRLTIIHADGLPVTRFLDRFKHRRFYVTVTDGVTTKTAKAIKRERQLARWDESFNSLCVFSSSCFRLLVVTDLMLSCSTIDPSSQLTLRLFAKRDSHDDVLVGVLELPYPELIRDSAPRDFHITPIHSTKPSQLVILRLEITIYHVERPSEAAVASSASGPSPFPRKADDGLALSPSSTPSAAETAPEVPSFAEMLDRVSLPAVDKAAGKLAAPSAPAASIANLAEQGSGTLDQTENMYDTWSIVLTRMKWVVDCTDEIAEIHPYAKIAWGFLSLIPKTIFAQVERDENVKTLVLAMHDALDLVRDVSVFESNIQDSAQRNILMAMLTHACACGEFIQTYAKDTQFWKRLLKNTGHEVDTRVEGYCSKLLAMRDGFLRHATVTIEKTTFQILDSVGGVSAQIDRVAGRLDDKLMDVLDKVADASMSTKIEQIPYPSGTSFRSDRGCLKGTRSAFLDYITDWVINPESMRGLVLFGQAGTGKSSIAHEVARRFRGMRLLASSFMFLRGDQSSREPRFLFTGLARDLSDRYPAFRSSLAKAIQYDTVATKGTKDLTIIFESLLLIPLADTALVGPVFLVIDALDEAQDTTGPHGLHTFLANHIHELPSNFRILITSRPEYDIKLAFHGLESVSAITMDDPELSSSSEKDIHAYLKHNLSADLYRKHGEKFAKKAEGLFQWAAAACGYVNTRRRGLTEDERVARILDSTPGRPQRVDPLDELYLNILESCFDLSDPVVKRRYQSVMGQLLVAFEPLSSQSLTALRRHLDNHDTDSGDSVLTIISDLGSLLSNVASADADKPITPLHTSFRDFLTTKDRAGKFWVDPANSHRQMAYCCLGLLIDEVHFNMCKLVSSCQKNLDVPDIHSLVSRHISHSLSYASRFWDNHLRHVPFHIDFVKKLQALLLAKFPFWLEALSLLGRIDLALQALSTLKEWLRKEQSVSA
ncbi:hypothetical protein BC834DRAFT_240164 [Gloeopeniophorella convolvens]|nr:hypothetical protein BC834DRAFT_240164 [Gloeopeniophorella convolvens]